MSKGNLYRITNICIDDDCLKRQNVKTSDCFIASMTHRYQSDKPGSRKLRNISTEYVIMLLRQQLAVYKHNSSLMCYSSLA